MATRGSKQVTTQPEDSQRTMRSMTEESQEGSQDIDTGTMQFAMDQHKKTVRNSLPQQQSVTPKLTATLKVQVRRRERETRIRKAHKQRFDSFRQQAEGLGEAHQQQMYVRPRPTSNSLSFATLLTSRAIVKLPSYLKFNVYWSCFVARGSSKT